MARRSAFRATLLIAMFALVAAGCTGDPETTATPTGEAQQPQQPEGEGTLQTVQQRERLVCGVNDAVPGFGVVDEAGEFNGFDIEFCKVVAAAVLGDSEAVDYVPLTTETRFTALQSAEVDVLIRNTTWTASRDGREGATFATTTFYDGQGMMVRADSAYQSLADMNNTIICVLSGTTTELNLAAVFGAMNLQFEQLSFEDNDTLQQAFQQERCDGWTSDKSQLAGVRSAWPDGEGGPDALRILEDTMSKEPLGPVTRDGDSQWSDVVNWAVLATIQAEEFGITSQNVEEMQNSDDPEVQRFLGVAGEEGIFDAGLGLDTDFVVNVISQVGNYGEIYDRNVGPNTPLGLERGVNNLWTEGGLLYAPPYR